MQDPTQKAAEIIKNGGVVIYPTDTAYALGGLYDSPKAIKQILKLKNRKDEKFTLIASSLYQVEKYFKLDSCQKKIARKFWPGPVSIVVNDKFAVRVPANKTAIKLAKLVGKPIIATSLNISGQLPVYDLKKCKICEKLFIINQGVLLKKPASAIVDCSKKIIIRPGNKKLNEQIRAALSS
ncbi:L-threonylcarbamoyladenylate synthase [Patescibacteria group bacterium]|nr:L-threonylcarbamoyladenylate synthase [Patescibacteria group bacterium]